MHEGVLDEPARRCVLVVAEKPHGLSFDESGEDGLRRRLQLAHPPRVAVSADFDGLVQSAGQAAADVIAQVHGEEGAWTRVLHVPARDPLWVDVFSRANRRPVSVAMQKSPLVAKLRSPQVAS